MQTNYYFICFCTGLFFYEALMVKEIASSEKRKYVLMTNKNGQEKEKYKCWYNDQMHSFFQMWEFVFCEMVACGEGDCMQSITVTIAEIRNNV